MANSLEKAINYIKDEKELDALTHSEAYLGDLFKEVKRDIKGSASVSVKTVKLSSTTAGTYDDATGYTGTDITTTFVPHTLTQDKGNSLHVDNVADEATLGDTLVESYKRYVRQVMNPTTDKYFLSTINGTSGLKIATDKTANDNTNIEDRIDTGIDYIVNKGLNVNAPTLLIISTSAARKLKQSARKSGNLQLGNWNGNINTQVLVYGDSLKLKVREIPDSYFPTNVDFVILPIDAFTGCLVNQDYKYWDAVPNFGTRRKQLDIGFFFDGWVTDGAIDFIYEHQVSA